MWAVLATLTVAACSSTVPPNSPPISSNQPKSETAKSEAAPEPAVALQVVKWPELQKTIAAHKGKVVVLDVWAEY
jgi:hypothetical protein